jgi:hypothetical protein
LGGITAEEYLADPFRGFLLANRALGVDGLVVPLIPTEPEAIRAAHLTEDDFSTVPPEALLERAEKLPDREAELLADFNAAAVEAEYRKTFDDTLGWCGEFTLLPTLWEVAVNFGLYFEYGYVAFLSAIALYPEAIARIFWADGIVKRRRNEIVVRLMQEYDFPPLLFTGYDICNNKGPMCSPAFLREHYWSHCLYALQPFYDAGIRVIHHCDGNVMPIVDDMVAAGFSGFQGFQYECGIDIADLRKRRSLKGEEMLILGGLSVTRTLPFGTIEDVKAEVDYCLDCTDGGRGFMLFTSNVVGVEVPPQNLLAAYRHLAAYDLINPPRRPCAQPVWPWGAKHLQK